MSNRPLSRFSLFFLLLASCTPPDAVGVEDKNKSVDHMSLFGPPEAYINPADQALARRNDLDDFPCRAPERVGEFLPTDECFRMLPARRYIGVWVNEFEGSLFYPDRTTPPESSDGERIWLDIDRSSIRDMNADGKAYLVELVGRRTMYTGRFGHLGFADHELIMDQLISIRELSSPTNR